MKHRTPNAAAVAAFEQRLAARGGMRLSLRLEPRHVAILRDIAIPRGLSYTGAALAAIEAADKTPGNID
jgi:predicted DNA-binding ribbon-helix-helix protein